ncbi:MAG: hydroxyacid dehydrogenase [Patescibacteria group bacterium]
MHKIGIFEIEGWEKELFEKEFFEHNLYFSEKSITANHLPEERDFTILSIFVGSKLTKEVLENFPNLKLITTRSTGFDHIDLNYCKEKGIVVCNVPSYGSETVAEWTIGLMLCLMRKIYYAIDQIKETKNLDFKNLRGEELSGKTLGVIGTGKIGKEVAKRAKAFNMNLIGYDLFPDEKWASEIGLKYVGLDELLSNSDVITIHCLLNESTYHLINKENIKKIKKGAYLINTARGEIVETDALIYALKEGILKGAALDVLEEERFLKEELDLLIKEGQSMTNLKIALENHILMEMPNVLITPHNAFNSKEAIERIIKTTIENIKNFMKGSLINVCE